MMPPLTPLRLTVTMLLLLPLLMIAAPCLGAPESRGVPRGFAHRGWLRLLAEGEGCGDCDPELCPLPAGCPAGTVPDHCDCCSECANAEGQICDLDETAHFYGRCGDHLSCVLDGGDAADGAERGGGGGGDGGDGEYGIPEPQCVCVSEQTLCGTDGSTYPNVCRLSEAAHRLGAQARNLSVAHEGPCETAPWIAMPPKDIVNVSGSDVVFGCEVSGFPMAFVEWRKEGVDELLPADDAHLAVQARGGPQRYQMTGWLQIHNVRPSDSGVYVCYARNRLGEAYATARLIIISPDSPEAEEILHNPSVLDFPVYDDEEDDDY
ncbi:kazal-type serine protease inhibitor domain-containing protein 1 [Lampetra fluviatilis]